MVISVPPSSRAFRVMWQLLSDSFPHNTEFTYQYHVKPIADIKMVEYAPRTRRLAWDSCRTVALENGQMTKLSAGSYCWGVVNKPPAGSRSFHAMWELLCDNFSSPFTWHHDVAPLLEKAMPEYSHKTRHLAWLECTRYGIKTDQMGRIGQQTYYWRPPVE